MMTIGWIKQCLGNYKGTPEAKKKSAEKEVYEKYERLQRQKRLWGGNRHSQSSEWCCRRFSGCLPTSAHPGSTLSRGGQRWTHARVLAGISRGGPASGGCADRDLRRGETLSSGDFPGGGCRELYILGLVTEGCSDIWGCSSAFSKGLLMWFICLIIDTDLKHVAHWLPASYMLLINK